MSHRPYVPGPHARAPWLMKLLIALDQLLNVLAQPLLRWWGWNADPDETVSSNAARHRDRWWGRILCKILDRLDPGHCDRAHGH